MLNFIFGRCEHGKSKFLKDMIYDSIKKGERNLIIIVPEQSSFETEMEMIGILGNSECNKVNVLSFSRLHDFVAKKLNLPPYKISGDIAQRILMDASLELTKDNLKFFRPNSKTSFSKFILETIKELKSRKIEIPMLEKIIDFSKNDITKQKIKEIIMILKNYNKFCADNSGDLEDSVNLLEKILNENHIFKDCIVMFDEFNGFTNQQMRILELIIKQAKNVYITFCVDKNCKPNCDTNLFYPVDRTVEAIKGIAKNNGIKTNEIMVDEANYRTSSNYELKILEENIFRAHKKSYDFRPKNIFLYSAMNIYDECENIARNIRKLVTEEDYKFANMAILSRNTDVYVPIIKNIFKKYNIPLFSNFPETVFNKSLPSLILSALECVASGFQTADVIRYFKSVLLDISAEESALIENYALLWGINGNEWLEDFSENPNGQSCTLTKEDSETLEKINSIRNAVISPLVKLKEKITDTSAKKISEAIYEFLIQVHADKNLKKFYQNLKVSGNLRVAEKEAKLWDKTMEILSLTAQIFGDIKLSEKKYILILSSAFEAVDCADIPQGQDTVLIGEALTTKLSNPKIVFLIGTSSGDFPLVANKSKLFADSEIKQIEKLGIEIQESPQLTLIKEQFLAYTCVCSASDKLYVSWSCSSFDGESKSPSEIPEEIKTIFPKIEISTINKLSSKDLIWSENSAFENFCSGYSSSSVISNTLSSYFENSAKYLAHVRSLENFKNQDELKFKCSENSKKLFGEKLQFSASQIEKYHKCSFAYFCQYGLKLKPQKPVKFGSLEYGNLMHAMLERIFKKYPENKIVSISIEILEKEVSEAIDEYVQNNIGKKLLKNSRTNYIINKAKKSSTLILKRFINEFRQSKFFVEDCELEISNDGAIPPLKIMGENDMSIEINGKIDRVDTFRESNSVYVRIIDYKTGPQHFELSGVLYGLNIQMLVYLMALKKNGTQRYGDNIVPAGALYFKAVKPSAQLQENESRENDDFLNIENDFFSQMQMSGLILNDLKIINAMEEKGAGEFIPVYIKNGKIYGSNCLASLGELSRIFDYIETLIKKMGESLNSGKVDVDPVVYAGFSACEYCDYFEICHYNKENFKVVPSTSKIGRDNILEQISGNI